MSLLLIWNMNLHMNRATLIELWRIKVREEFWIIEGGRIIIRFTYKKYNWKLLLEQGREEEEDEWFKIESQIQSWHLHLIVYRQSPFTIWWVKRIWKKKTILAIVFAILSGVLWRGWFLKWSKLSTNTKDWSRELAMKFQEVFKNYNHKSKLIVSSCLIFVRSGVWGENIVSWPLFKILFDFLNILGLKLIFRIS